MMDREAARAEMRARIEARQSMLSFVQYTTPRWSPGPIHRTICRALDDVIEGAPGAERTIIMCPPQHGKSTIVSKRAAAYILGRNPTEEIIGVSATAPLADEFGAATRDCVSSPLYRNVFRSTTLREDSRAKGRWQTEQGGGYYSVGIGGALFGRGGMAIIDDPFASWEDAQSPTERRKVWDWYTGTLYNRIHPGKPIIVIQHRLHEQDLVGNLLDAERRGGDRWRIVRLDADLDNPPWPQRYDRAALERIKANMTPRQWAALYLNDPAPEDGTEFLAEWWQQGDPPARENLQIYMSGDFAVTEEQKSGSDPDYSAVYVWGVDHLSRVYALACVHGRFTSDVLVGKLVAMFREWRPIRFIGEAGPIRRAIEPFLRHAMRETGVFATLEWLPAVRDKVTNATSFAALMANGRVYWPRTDWAEETRSQLLKFPGGRHDDRVDACSLFGRHIGEVFRARASEEPKPPPDWTAPMRLAEIFGSRVPA